MVKEIVTESLLYTDSSLLPLYYPKKLDELLQRSLYFSRGILLSRTTKTSSHSTKAHVEPKLSLRRTPTDSSTVTRCPDWRSSMELSPEFQDTLIEMNSLLPSFLVPFLLSFFPSWKTIYGKI